MLKKSIFFLVISSFLLGCNSENQNTNGEQRLNNNQVTQSSELAEAKSTMIPKVPNSMEFCGETINFDDFDKKERLDLELIVNTHYHSSTIQIIKRAHRYFPEMEQAIKKAGLPDDLKYIAVIESALKQATSPSGAKGIWQFMKPAGKEFGLEISNQVDERKNISKSTTAAMQYLKSSYRKFGDWKLAISSYNCGAGGLQKQIDKQGTKNYFDLYLNSETSRYYFRALALKLIMENPSVYGFEVSEEDLYSPIPTKSIKVTSTIDDLAKWAQKQGTSYRKLKVLNPWLISDKLKVKNQTYFIKIPA